MSANCLNQSDLELENLLITNRIYISLTWETYFSDENYIKIKEYNPYYTTHPWARAMKYP